MTTSAPLARARARSLGLGVGALPSGPLSAITDVPGVCVGHATIWRDAPTIVRTGATAVVFGDLGEQFHRPMAAGVAVLNGAGELTGAHAVREWGSLETPVVLTNTMSVGAAYHGVCEAMIAAVVDVGADDVVIPVVAECDDSWLNDARTMAVSPGDVRAAIDAASTEFAIGAVGAGTGMTCFGLKGGIGSASRVVDGATVGVLTLCNFGQLDRLTIDGTVVGRTLVAEGHGRHESTPPAGSCIVIIATDARVAPAGCERLARRAGLGLARVGSVAYHGSGELFLACSTTYRRDRSARRTDAEPARTGRALDPLFEAVVDATEEAVLDALCAADTVEGIDGHRSPGLPVDRVFELCNRTRHP